MRPAEDAAVPVPEAGEADVPPEPSAFLPCRPAWVLPPDAATRTLDGALSGKVAAVLVEHAGIPVLLLIAGRQAESTSVALPEGSEGSANAGGLGRLLGRVASRGDRFLVAYGRVASGRVELRVRAVMPEARLLPVDSPGRPGTAGEPFYAGPVGEGAVQVLLDAYPDAMFVAISGPGIAATGWTSATGAPRAPSAVDETGWSLAPPPEGSAAPWLVPLPIADSAAARYVGPLGRWMLVVNDGDGSAMLVDPPSSQEDLRFVDGWVPAAGEPVGFAPDRVFRRLPGEGPPRVLAYDVNGSIVSRLELPAGSAPLALSRDARSMLVVGGDGAILSCGVDVPAGEPIRVDASATLDHPGSGAATCGRGR